MADKLVSDALVLEILNKLLESDKISVRKFTPLDQAFPVNNLTSSEISVTSFDEGTDRGIQSITIQIVSNNTAINETEVSKVQNTMFNRIHQKVDEISQIAGSDWKFHSVTCDSIGTTQIYDKDSPGTAGTMSVKFICEYVGN